VTERDALLLVEQIDACYSPPMPDLMVRAWAAELARLDDREAAQQAVLTLVREMEQRPTLARFLEAYRMHARNRARQRAETHGLPEPERAPIPAETVAWLEQILGRPLKQQRHGAMPLSGDTA
jgi:hypothetical protein